MPVMEAACIKQMSTTLMFLPSIVMRLIRVAFAAYPILLYLRQRDLNSINTNRL